MLHLIRATYRNGIFAQIESQWKQETEKLSPDGETIDYLPTMMEHAKKIAAEDIEDPRYGIFALQALQDNAGTRYQGIIHVNHKLPNTSAATVRMVWNLLSPQLEYDQSDLIAEMMTSYLIGGIKLCQGSMRSESLQMYLHNGTDRRYAVGAVSVLRELHPELDIDVRGMWLHINDISSTLRQGRAL